MKLPSILLLLSGWFILLAAIALLGRTPGARAGFMLAGLAMQGAGLVYFFRSHRSVRQARKR